MGRKKKEMSPVKEHARALLWCEFRITVKGVSPDNANLRTALPKGFEFLPFKF